VNDQDAYESGDTLPEEGKRENLLYEVIHIAGSFGFAVRSETDYILLFPARLRRGFFEQIRTSEANPAPPSLSQAVISARPRDSRPASIRPLS
jgi:hypothetical protein